MDKYKLTVNIKFATLIIGLVLIGLFSFFYWKTYQSQDKLISFIGMGLGLLSLIYVAINTHIIISQLDESRKQNKENNTSKLLEHTYSNDFMNTVVLLTSTWDKIKDKDENEKLNFYLTNDEIRTKLLSALNYFEYCSFLANHNIIDRELFLEYLGDVLEAYYLKYSFLITYYRSKSMTNKMYSEMTELISKHKREYKSSNRQQGHNT